MTHDDLASSRRIAERRTLERPAIVYGSSELPGWVVNVSSAGALLEVPVPEELPLGQVIALDINVPGAAQPLWVRGHGRVVRVHQARMPRQYGIAIERWEHAV